MKSTLFSVFFFCLANFALAQQSISLTTKNGNLTFPNNIDTFKLAKNATNCFYQNNYFVLIVLDNTYKLELLKAKGILLHQTVTKNIYTATILQDADWKSLGIQSILPIPNNWKYNNIEFANIPQTKHTSIAISFFGITKENAIATLQQHGITITHPTLEAKQIIYCTYNLKKLDILSNLPFVTNITPAVHEPKLLANESNAMHGVSAMQSSTGRNLSGEGITLGHGDLGLATDHIDLDCKIINRYTGSGNFHGVLTSGITSGAGIINEKYKGMAPKSPTVSALFTDIILNTPSYITDYNMVATNNSYFSGLGGCPGNGAYNDLSIYMDALTHNYPTALHVFAAGNDGGIACSPYPINFGTVKSGFQTGKNVLTVGSINGANYNVSAFSSRGPVRDGRLKPEIIAKGENLIGTVPVNIYGFNSGGTSHSTPVVTGSIALLQQRHKQLNGGATAKSDLVKALLCNSADDLGNAGPDYTYGFGMLNIKKSIEALEQNQYFNGTIANTGAENTHIIAVPANVAKLKVMLYWIDKEGNLIAPTNLVNDLDVTVTTPSSAIHLPLVLSSIPGNVENVATEGVDRLNNIEQCTLLNPTNGNYTVKVNGFNLSVDNQQYIIVYQIDAISVNILYPYGGEKLLPNENEPIRWTAAGSDANDFTIEYSNNNGTSWNVLSSTVPGTSRSFNWTTPTTTTVQGLIRISRNSTGLSTTSTTTFVILDAPTLVVTNSCNGYAQLNWTTIADATSYEVMQLFGDSMRVIATTTSTEYLVTGLAANTTYWFALRSLKDGKAGRRAIARSIIPNSGSCSLPVLDNDIKLESINTPTTGRHLTSTANNALANISITIRNNDDVPSTTALNFNYSINGGATVTETATPTIPVNGLFNYTFASHSPLSTPANYSIKVWVDKVGDVQHGNDTLIKTVRLLPNAALTLPFTDDFETTTNATYTTKSVGLLGNDRFDFNTNVFYGRGRSFVNTGFSRSGSKAFTLDQLNVGGFALDTLTGTFNLSTYDTATNQLRAEVYFKDHGQDAGANNKIWIRGSDANNWIEAYDLGTQQNTLGNYQLVTLNVNDLFANATPKQNFSTSFQIAMGQEGRKPATIVNPFNRNEDGYTFDDVKLINALNDIGLQRIVAPLQNTCNLSATTPIVIQVKNYSNTTQNNIQVSYQVNGGAIVTENIATLNAQQTINYTFSTTANLAAFIDYRIDYWVNLATDNYSGNDSILKYEFHNSPLVTTYPYLERFETGNGNWFAKGTNSSWAWGVPSQTVINKAPNGTKAWVTSLSTGYNDNETSYINSPCFDLSSLTNPMLSFSHIIRIEDDCPCDYSWMEYSTNGGLTWQKLGAVGQGTNWYDNATVQAWQASKARWHVASIAIPTTSAATKFRLVMQSDGGVTYGGVGIDDVHIYEAAPIYTGGEITSGLTQTISGSIWQHYTAGGNRIASLNADANNLGNTEVKVYPFSGAVRNSNGQYYVNRNIVVQPTTQPATPVSVRFYFTDVEVEDVLNATGCGACTKPNDAYEFGITKYQGPIAEENGTLADNTLPASYILPGAVDIIPYENGYYAEYTVNSFSEFWLNNGGVGNNQPLPLQLVQFTATKQTSAVLLQWQTTNETNLVKYIIERSTNGVDFVPIAEKIAMNNPINNYSYIDASITTNKNYYYRLQIIDRNNSQSYSPIRLVSFSSNLIMVSLAPNPSKGTTQLVSNQLVTQVQLYTTTGKLVWTEKVNNTTKLLNLTNIAKGQYNVKISTATNVVVQKLVVE